MPFLVPMCFASRFLSAPMNNSPSLDADTTKRFCITLYYTKFVSFNICQHRINGEAIAI